MAKALVLGSGAALSAKGRFNTTLAILEGPRTILLDCAAPCTELLYHHGIDITSVDTVVLSHMHADHITGIGQLAHMKHHFVDFIPPRAYFDRQNSFFKDSLRHPTKEQWDYVSGSLTIYVPAGVEHVVSEYLKTLYMRSEVFTKFELRVASYGKGDFYEDGTFSIAAYPNAHIRHYYPELVGTDAVMESYTLVVRVTGKTCLYSSGLRRLDEVEAIVRQADVIFLEGAHCSPGEILAFAERLDLKRVFVLHIHAAYEEAFANLKRDLTRANVTVTHDGFEVAL
jgi:ribonuclease BN (tRNA processing enzyme)